MVGDDVDPLIRLHNRTWALQNCNGGSEGSTTDLIYTCDYFMISWVSQPYMQIFIYVRAYSFRSREKFRRLSVEYQTVVVRDETKRRILAAWKQGEEDIGIHLDLRRELRVGGSRNNGL